MTVLHLNLIKDKTTIVLDAVETDNIILLIHHMFLLGLWEEGLGVNVLFYGPLFPNNFFTVVLNRTLYI